MKHIGDWDLWAWLLLTQECHLSPSLPLILAQVSQETGVVLSTSTDLIQMLSQYTKAWVEIEREIIVRQWQIFNSIPFVPGFRRWTCESIWDATFYIYYRNLYQHDEKSKHSASEPFLRKARLLPQANCRHSASLKPSSSSQCWCCLHGPIPWCLGTCLFQANQNIHTLWSHLMW